MFLTVDFQMGSNFSARLSDVYGLVSNNVLTASTVTVAVSFLPFFELFNKPVL